MSLRAETNFAPRMTYNFRIRVDGLLAVTCSGVQLPERQVTEVEHSGGGANVNTKHPGKVKYTDLVIEKAMHHEQSDRFAYDWMTSVRGDTGTGNPLTGRRTVTIEHIADDGDRIIDSWEILGVWVKTLAYSKSDSMQDAEKMMETITCSVFRYRREDED